MAKISISQNCGTKIYIKNRETNKELEIDLRDYTLEDYKELINGLGNILTDIACYIIRR